MHLSFGRLIVESKSIPDYEIFQFSMQDQPFNYSSWLFGSAIYLAFLLGGPSGPILLKALILCSAWAAMYYDAVRPYRNRLLALAGLAALAVFAQYRFVVRPEMALMFFLPFSIFALNAYRYERKKYLYVLPLVHLLWGNTHSSINLMFVPFGAFLAGGLLQKVFAGRKFLESEAPDMRQLRTVLLVFGLSFLGSILSPYGLRQYFYAAQYMSSEWFQQAIFELMPPTQGMRQTIFVIDAVVVLTLLLNLKRLSLTDVLLVLPFLYLPFMGIRFIFISYMITVPVAIRNLSGFLDRFPSGKGMQHRWATIAGTVVVLAVCLFAAMRIPPVWLQEREPGFGFDYRQMPRGAVNYLDRRGISGRVMNHFHFGQYIVWTGFPERSIFIDSRGYLTPELLEKYSRFTFSPPMLQGLQKQYGFEILMLNYPVNFASNVANDFWFRNRDWALVYFDDTALVYLRRKGPFQSIIDADEYRYVKPDMSIYYFRDTLLPRTSEKTRKRWADELLRNIRETGSKVARDQLFYIRNSLRR